MKILPLKPVDSIITSMPRTVTFITYVKPSILTVTVFQI